MKQLLYTALAAFLTVGTVSAAADENVQAISYTEDTFELSVVNKSSASYELSAASVESSSMIITFDIATNANGGFADVFARDTEGNSLFFMNLYNGGFAYGTNDYTWSETADGDNNYSVKLIVNDGISAMYVDNMDTPITELATSAAGISYFEAVSTWSSSDIIISNLTVTLSNNTVEPTPTPTINPDYIIGDMLFDGGFESDDPTALVDWAWNTSTPEWQTTGSTRINDSTVQGEYALELINNGIGQMVDLEIGKCYKLTVNAKGTGTLQYAVNDGNARYPGTFGTGYTQKEYSLTDEWTQLSYEFTNTSLTKGLVYFWAVGTAYIDNAVLSEITPTTVTANKLDIPAEHGEIKDTVGFTHTFTVPEITSVTSVTWNISNGDSDPSSVDADIPVISGGTCIVGLIITNVPEDAVDRLCATVTVK